MPSTKKRTAWITLVFHWAAGNTDTAIVRGRICNHSKPNRLGIVNGTCNTAHLHRLRPAARQGADPYPTGNLSISSNGHTGKLLIDSPGKHRHWRIRLDTPSISFRNHGGCRSWHLRLRCYSGSHYPSVFNLYLQPAYRLFCRELSLMQSPLFYPLNPLHPHRNHSDWTLLAI